MSRVKCPVLRHPCPSAKFYGLPSWLSAFPFFWLMQTATVPGMLTGELLAGIVVGGFSARWRSSPKCSPPASAVAAVLTIAAIIATTEHYRPTDQPTATASHLA